MLKSIYRIAVILIIVPWSGTAEAADCTVNTSGINFGIYDPLGTSNLDSIGTITIRCTGKVNVTVSIGPSPNTGGFNPRAMKIGSGTSLLNYNLYTTSARTQIWGDGTQGTATVSGLAPRNKDLPLSVYSRVPPGQDVTVGSYSENVVVTINW